MHPPRERGFTLAELMITVALVGILAVIGISTFRSEIAASKTNEPAAVIQAIRAAQEAFRAENQQYLNISSASDAWYPKPDFSGKQYAWRPATGGGGYSDHAAWTRLGAAVTQPVTFRYLVNAGGAGSSFPGVSVGIALPTAITGTRPEPWYLIQARADANQNSTYCDVIATSLNNEIALENAGE